MNPDRKATSTPSVWTRNRPSVSGRCSGKPNARETAAGLSSAASSANPLRSCAAPPQWPSSWPGCTTSTTNSNASATTTTKWSRPSIRTSHRQPYRIRSLCWSNGRPNWKPWAWRFWPHQAACGALVAFQPTKGWLGTIVEGIAYYPNYTIE